MGRTPEEERTDLFFKRDSRMKLEGGGGEWNEKEKEE